MALQRKQTVDRNGKVTHVYVNEDKNSGIKAAGGSRGRSLPSAPPPTAMHSTAAQAAQEPNEPIWAAEQRRLDAAMLERERVSMETFDGFKQRVKSNGFFTALGETIDWAASKTSAYNAVADLRYKAEETVYDIRRSGKVREFAEKVMDVPGAMAEKFVDTMMEPLDKPMDKIFRD